MPESLLTIRALLSTTPARWQQLAALPAELVTRRPAPHEWSPMECLHHLLESEERVFAPRLAALLAGQTEIVPFDPQRDGTPYAAQRDPAELVAAFAAARAASLELLERVQPQDLERQARHLELGPITLGQQLHEWVAHDLVHTMQAERALMQPFIRAAGPWQADFAEHLIAAESDAA